MYIYTVSITGQFHDLDSMASLPNALFIKSPAFTASSALVMRSSPYDPLVIWRLYLRTILDKTIVCSIIHPSSREVYDISNKLTRSIIHTRTYIYYHLLYIISTYNYYTYILYLKNLKQYILFSYGWGSIYNLSSIVNIWRLSLSPFSI